MLAAALLLLLPLLLPHLLLLLQQVLAQAPHAELPAAAGTAAGTQ
jgi:hypothetical protein